MRETTPCQMRSPLIAITRKAKRNEKVEPMNPGKDFERETEGRLFHFTSKISAVVATQNLYLAHSTILGV